MRIKYITTKNAKAGYPYGLIIDEDNKTITTGYCLGCFGFDKTIHITYKEAKFMIELAENAGFKHLEG